MSSSKQTVVQDSSAQRCSSCIQSSCSDVAYCTCEAAKVKELYDAFYGDPADHASGAKNVGQWGKLPPFKGPKIWAPPWLKFSQSQAPKKPPEQEEPHPTPDISSAVAMEPTEQVVEFEPIIAESLSPMELLCKCSDSCYTKHSQQGAVNDGALDSYSDTLVASETNYDPTLQRKKSKKKESISVKDIAHNLIPTPSVILSKMELRVKSEITPAFISLISFIQVAIKAVHVKILRYKHSSRLAAINFSGSRKNIAGSCNDIITSVLTYSGCCYQIYAKGEDDVRLVPTDYQGPYIVVWTALNGDVESLDYGLDVGSIFSIYRRDPKLSPFAPRTANMSYKYLVSSGYAVYSTNTKLVISIGRKLCSFILDPVAEEFIMNDDSIRIPEKGTLISVDEGHSGLWEPQILEYMKRKKDPKQGRPLKTRYIGSLVADFHRILYQGGIYLYPANRKNPQGKTTLLCECVPLAHIVDLAGGSASTGKADVLKTEADQLGQYKPFFIGSKHEVQELLLITSSPVRG